MVRDANGCEVFEVIQIEEVIDINLNTTSQNASCGEANGEAAIEITGGTAPYLIEWSNGSDAQAIADLGAGTYTVTVTDAKNCVVTSAVDVTETSGLSATINKVDLDCAGDANGLIDFMVSGGSTPYEYTWSTGENVASLTDLPAGDYMVTVVDADGCQLIEAITIQEPPVLLLDVTMKNIICGEDTGSATAMGFGGTGAFTYEWSTGETTPEIMNLTPGTYTVTLTDGSGCTQESSIEVTEVGSAVSASIEVNQQPMGDQSIGSLTAIGSGGDEPYSYEWSTREFTQTIENLPAGTYSVTIIDANSCFGVAEIELMPLANLDCTIEITNNLSESGSNDGAVQTIVTGGLEPYTYQWEDGSTTASITNLGPGTYSVTVTDANNQITTCSIELEETPEICINLDDPGSIGFDQELCGPGNDPAELVNVELPTGGEGEIEYLWMKSTQPGPFDPVTWDVIPNSNAPNYDPGPIYETTYFARCARIVGCPAYLETSILTIKVLDVAVAEITSAHVPVCQDEPYEFTALDNGEGATYFWNFGTNANPSTSTDLAVDVVWMSKGLKRVSLTVEKDGCISNNFLWITVTDSPIYCGDGLEIDGDEEEDEVIITWDKDKDLDDDPNDNNDPDEENGTGVPVFEVERASANHDFFPIEKVVEPYDSTATKYLYRFIDKNPLDGVSYYRVQFKDRWKNQMQSNEVEIQVFEEKLGEVFAYPNPFFQIFTIERVDFHTEKAITLDIRSATGQNIILTGLNEEELRRKIDMDLYSAGVYFVKVLVDGEELRTFRLVKINH